MIVNITEAKNNLSKLVDRVLNGEKVVITKRNIPLVDLVIHKPAPKGKRQLGLLKGQFELPESFLDEDGIQLAALRTRIQASKDSPLVELDPQQFLAEMHEKSKG